MGCIVCRHEGFDESPAEIHHIRSGVGKGQRASNFEVLPLCPLHHRLGGWGVAFHAGSKKWQELYGAEKALLEQVEWNLAKYRETIVGRV